MQIDLDETQTAIVAARTEQDSRIRLETERFERFVERRLGRLKRERDANRQKLYRALSKAVGRTIPPHAEIAIKADGTGMVVWSSPADPKPALATEKAEEPAKAEPATEPKNGAAEPAGAAA